MYIPLFILIIICELVSYKKKKTLKTAIHFCITSAQAQCPIYEKGYKYLTEWWMNKQLNGYTNQCLKLNNKEHLRIFLFFFFLVYKRYCTVANRDIPVTTIIMCATPC